MSKAWSSSFTAAATLVAALCAGPAAAQPLALVPGQTYANVAAAVLVIRTTSGGAPLTGQVSFDRADSLTQNILLYAAASTLGPAWQTAAAQGALYVDFCVPRPGASICDTVSDPAAPDIDVNLTFKYGVFGEVSSQLNSKARFDANVRLIDQETKRAIEHRVLGSLSVSGPQWKVIKKVPVPLPKVDDAQVVQPVTFSTFLRRGKIYRFQLGGAAYAESRLSGVGISNFMDPMVMALAPGQSGRVQLHDLTIRVGQEAPNLDEQIAELQAALRVQGEHLVALGEHVDEGLQSLADDLATQGAQLADLAQRTAAPGALLFREPGAAAPDGALPIGRFRLASSDRSSPVASVAVDVYVMPSSPPVAAQAGAPRR